LKYCETVVYRSHDLDGSYMMQYRAVAFLMFLALGTTIAACDSSTRVPDTLPQGEWGGEHIGLVVTNSDVFFLFDCAGGHVAGPLRLDATGAFDVTGTFTGGGNAFGADHSAHPARYVGHADATTITVKMMRLDTVDAGATATAVLGAAPQVVAC
jgi:hypothetical protein